jgi:hypothetical protein
MRRIGIDRVPRIGKQAAESFSYFAPKPSLQLIYVLKSADSGPFQIGRELHDPALFLIEVARKALHLSCQRVSLVFERLLVSPQIARQANRRAMSIFDGGHFFVAKRSNTSKVNELLHSNSHELLGGRALKRSAPAVAVCSACRGKLAKCMERGKGAPRDKQIHAYQHTSFG